MRIGISINGLRYFTFDQDSTMRRSCPRSRCAVLSRQLPKRNWPSRYSAEQAKPTKADYLADATLERLCRDWARVLRLNQVNRLLNRNLYNNFELRAYVRLQEERKSTSPSWNAEPRRNLRWDGEVPPKGREGLIQGTRAKLNPVMNRRIHGSVSAIVLAASAPKERTSKRSDARSRKDGIHRYILCIHWPNAILKKIPSWETLWAAQMSSADLLLFVAGWGLKWSGSQQSMVLGTARAKIPDC